MIKGQIVQLHQISFLDLLDAYVIFKIYQYTSEYSQLSCNKRQIFTIFKQPKAYDSVAISNKSCISPNTILNSLIQWLSQYFILILLGMKQQQNCKIQCRTQRNKCNECFINLFCNSFINFCNGFITFYYGQWQLMVVNGSQQ